MYTLTYLPYLVLYFNMVQNILDYKMVLSVLIFHLQCCACCYIVAYLTVIGLVKTESCIKIGQLILYFAQVASVVT